MTAVDQASYTALHQELKDLRDDVRNLSSKLEAVIRLEGDMQRHGDLVDRIGTQVDDHEKRLRSIEQTGATTRERVRGQASSTERVWWIVGLVLAAIIGAWARGGGV